MNIEKMVVTMEQDGRLVLDPTVAQQMAEVEAEQAAVQMSNRKGGVEEGSKKKQVCR